MMPIITFDNVSFRYNDGPNVLHNVDFSVEQGEFVSIVGANGSGKSTLAKLMCALLAPTQGTVTIKGKNTCDKANLFFARRTAGIVLQNPDDQLVASVVENEVAFGPENLSVAPDELRVRVTQALEAVGLSGYKKREVNSLSGGQKQRLALAGVLALQPEILVLDEADSMLDPYSKKAFLNMCRTLHHQGITLVMITHFMEEACLADRLIVMDEGACKFNGKPKDVFVRHEQELTACGLQPPFALQLSRALQSRGIAVPLCVNTDELKDELCG